LSRLIWYHFVGFGICVWLERTNLLFRLNIEALAADRSSSNYSA
jgi:hypothetical protein